MRLKQRMNVLLPQPDGPMNAVTKFLRTSSVDALERDVAGVATPRGPLTANTVSAPRPSGVTASAPSLPESIRGRRHAHEPRGSVTGSPIAQWGSGW